VRVEHCQRVELESQEFEGRILLRDFRDAELSHHNLHRGSLECPECDTDGYDVLFVVEVCRLPV